LKESERKKIKEEQERIEAAEKLRRREEAHARYLRQKNEPKPELPLSFFRHYTEDKIDPVNLR
jgi:hypothetical protein